MTSGRDQSHQLPTRQKAKTASSCDQEHCLSSAPRDELVILWSGRARRQKYSRADCPLTLLLSGHLPDLHHLMGRKYLLAVCKLQLEEMNECNTVPPTIEARLTNFIASLACAQRRFCSLPSSRYLGRILHRCSAHREDGIWTS